jgi:murein DD-endopeptidase MepM/ murein hydrolase activator NlpD
LRLTPAVAAALLCALVTAAPATAAFPDYPGDPRLEPPAETFVVPLRGPLHSPFGARWGRTHSGIDIAVLGTDRVVASLSGVVTATGYLRSYSGYGNTVKIRHPDGVTTLYAHLASASVRPGDTVTRGEPIARAGCTGSCTGPHLHFEVRVRGKLVDPLRFLPKTLR